MSAGRLSLPKKPNSKLENLPHNIEKQTAPEENTIELCLSDTYLNVHIV